MGRIRTVKPEFFLHEELFDLEQETELPLRIAYVGLWTQCDREGRFKWNPRRLKIQVLPYDNLDFSRVLDALTTRGFLVKYEHSGEEYGWIPTFKEHQFINNKEKDSKLPNPEKSNIISGLTRDVREGDALTSRGVKEGKGKEREQRVPDASGDLKFLYNNEIVPLHPTKANKVDGYEQFLKAVRPNGEIKTDLLKTIKADLKQRAAEDKDWLRGFVPALDKYFRNEMWTQPINKDKQKDSWMNPKEVDNIK